MTEKTPKNVCLTFLSMIDLKNKTVAHVFLPSFNNKDSCLRQERLLQSRNVATMLAWSQMSLCCRWGQSHFFLKSDTSLIRHLELVPWYSSVIFLRSLRHGPLPRSLCRFLWISSKRTPSSLLVHFTYLEFYGYNMRMQFKSYKVGTQSCLSNTKTRVTNSAYHRLEDFVRSLRNMGFPWQLLIKDIQNYTKKINLANKTRP